MKWQDMTPRERDALVAEKVMQWHVYKTGRGSIAAIADFNGEHEREYIVDAKHPWDNNTFSPTERISDAWLVVGKLMCEKWNFVLDGGWEDWRCDFHKGTRTCTGLGETVQEAICLAALKACVVSKSSPNTPQTVHLP